ncbi:hypothetical protein CWE12_03815 [Aliidiomarina sedimenti]|uniref:Uncharacterized protein n=1 Tax=Aliidiomarina sedimenti TaxID=1933879 RepID=A0ABY0C2N7_9GAMM|nr:hypothetical protein CWE12_03815 [Aliidiomarina sedimenti]
MVKQVVTADSVLLHGRKWSAFYLAPVVFILLYTVMSLLTGERDISGPMVLTAYAIGVVLATFAQLVVFASSTWMRQNRAWSVLIVAGPVFVLGLWLSFNIHSAFDAGYMALIVGVVVAEGLKQRALSSAPAVCRPGRSL